MGKFLRRRFIHLITVLIGISFLSFFLANISAIDPAEAYARRISRVANEETIESYRQELGFNQSIPKQYIDWVNDVVHLDFGVSYISGKPVIEEIITVLPPTLLLSFFACFFIVVFSIPLGVISALKQGKIIDKIICALSFVSISIPSYFLGLLCLLVFGIKFKIMPIVGHGHPTTLLFASLILAFPMIGTLTRILRSLLLENQENDYVTYAKARGISKGNVMIKHLLRNAAPTCITMFGQNIGYLIAGTAIVETVFSTPGLGQYALTAAINRDFPVINAYCILMTLFFVVCNVGAEICSMLLNPKLMQEDSL